MINTKPILTRLVEVEDEQGFVQMGVVEQLKENGEITVKILATNKILVFKPNFPIKLN